LQKNKLQDFGIARGRDSGPYNEGGLFPGESQNAQFPHCEASAQICSKVTTKEELKSVQVPSTKLCSLAFYFPEARVRILTKRCHTQVNFVSHSTE